MQEGEGLTRQDTGGRLHQQDDVYEHAMRQVRMPE